MAKSNAFTVAQLKSLPVGKHCDGQGLWLHKRADGGAQWVFRFNLWGRQPEIGLGSFGPVSLAETRKKAACLVSKWRQISCRARAPGQLASAHQDFER